MAIKRISELDPETVLTAASEIIANRGGSTKRPTVQMLLDVLGSEGFVLTDVAQARGNLGLGSAALLNSSAFATATQGGKADAHALRFASALGLVGEPILFTTSGTYTPTAGARYARIELLGAGAGAGGTAAGAGQSGTGAGGGPGAYASFIVDLSALTGSPTITVGALGTGGAPGGNSGNDGGDTSYDDTGVGGSHNITAEGGKGGAHASNVGAEQMARGGLGGDVVETSGTADVKISGQQAGHGIVINGSGGSGDVMSGHGGHSRFGTGAPGKVGGNAGEDGQGYGSGGSGAAQSGTTNLAGGDGTQGLVRITELF